MAHPGKTATGKRTATQDRGWRKLADFGQLKLGRMVQQKARKKTQKAAMLLLMLFSVQVMEATRWPMLETAQPLPQECSDRLKQYGCPERRYFPEKWHNYSQVCCAMDYPQTVLHCQEPLINGKTNIFAVCRPDQTIPPGKLGGLIQNDKGFLEVDLTTDCAPGTYRTHSINSSFIRYPYCKKKTKEAHAEVMCDGGTINNDLLMCQEGFVPDCFPEIQDLSICPCHRLQCGQGSQPVRNIAGHCNDSSSRATYGCTAPMSSIENSTAVSSVSPEKPQESSPVMTPGLTTSSTDTNTKEQGWSVYVIIGISVGVFGPAALIALFCVWRWCRKRARKSQREKSIPYSACSSTEEVEIQILTQRGN